ncbi:glycosyltransferase family 69 protein, partial [Melanomma pulvis-pyrius CBS 109.77]
HLSSLSALTHSFTPRRRLRSVPRTIYWSVFFLPYFIVFLVLFMGIVFPSYTHRPAHYNELRQLSRKSTLPGRANSRNEKVFIAASIYEKNGELTSGAWGKSVLDLVDLLGPANVYLSVYENDPDALTRKSLLKFKKGVTCNSSITIEDFDMSTLPRITLPSGETRIKRIAFLAEVRNRALAPIDKAGVQFDRILYINDVNFDPIEAAQLLFSTNVDSTGRANYGAACAVDFINPFKFYDRFATRDLDGFDMGIPFYPWFTSGGTATSRNDVLAGSDAVRVRSCWGGMTAFEAKWFQDQAPFDRDSSSTQTPSSSPNPNLNLAPLRFRYSEDIYWEASECCLVNGDLQYRRSGVGMPADSGIYMNPFIRVAYDTTTLSWLSFTRRPERLYSLIHNMLNPLVGFPHNNPRRTEEPGETIKETVWKFDDPVAAFKPDSTNEQRSGHAVEASRIVEPGGFCGGRFLLVMHETPEHGKGKWGKINLPGPPA